MLLTYARGEAGDRTRTSPQKRQRFGQWKIRNYQVDPHWVLSRTRLWADQSHRVERREHDSRGSLGRAHAGAVTLAKDATGEVGVAARWEVGNVSVGGHILEPNAGAKLEVPRAWPLGSRLRVRGPTCVGCSEQIRRSPSGAAEVSTVPEGGVTVTQYCVSDCTEGNELAERDS